MMATLGSTYYKALQHNCMKICNYPLHIYQYLCSNDMEIEQLVLPEQCRQGLNSIVLVLQKVRKQGIRFWDARTFWHEIIYKSLIPTLANY